MKGLTLIFLLVICVAFLLVGCGGSGEGTNTANSSGNKASANTSTSKTETGSSSTSSSGAATGVAACDEYLTKIEKCMNNPNVPEAMKAAYRQSLEQNRAAWKKAAATPEGKAGLEKSCKQALDSAKTFIDTCK